jgi:hypothetical protein
VCFKKICFQRQRKIIEELCIAFENKEGFLREIEKRLCVRQAAKVLETSDPKSLENSENVANIECK